MSETKAGRNWHQIIHLELDASNGPLGRLDDDAWASADDVLS
jgi:hypothetical protein